MMVDLFVYYYMVEETNNDGLYTTYLVSLEIVMHLAFIIMKGFQTFNMVGQEIACLAPREREHSSLPTGLVDLRKSSPVKCKTASQVPRNVRFDGKTPLSLDMMLDFSVYYLKKCLKS